MSREFLLPSVSREDEPYIGGKIEIDENFLNHFQELSQTLPPSVRPNFEAFINGVNNLYIFRDVERLLADLTEKDKNGPPEELLEESHRSYEQIANLGYQLTKYGLEIPWITPQAAELLAREKQKLEQGEKVGQVNLFRTPEEEQMIKLITKHDALQKVLEYQQAKASGKKLKLPLQQQQSMEHILQQLEQVRPEWREDLEKLATDPQYYHQSLDTLRGQLEQRLARQSLAA